MLLQKRETTGEGGGGWGKTISKMVNIPKGKRDFNSDYYEQVKNF